MNSQRLLVVAALTAAALSGSVSGQAVFVPERLADGVYALVPQPRFDDLDGNSLAVIGKEAILLVDTGGSLESGRLLVAQIKKLSPLPVRYVVNTHWHYDHVLGNAAILEAWPAAKIVAHDETARIGETWAQYYPDRALAALPATRQRVASEASTGKAADGRSLSSYELTVAKAQHANADRLERKFKESKYILPTTTFHDSLRLELGGRIVEVWHPGRGNTPGDAVVWIREAGIIATGDLLVHPVPYGFNSFPGSWTFAMEWLRETRAATLLPGHGPVQRDQQYIKTVEELLKDVVRQVRACVAKNMSLDETRKTVDLSRWRTLLATDDERRYSFAINFEAPIIERAWREARGEF
jgi:glyoxylase-like metal-dependent hydrolase (beta-lactamase superfamily II)